MTDRRTLIEVVRLSTGYLEGRGSTSPRLDAELLAAMALGIRRLDVYLQFDRPLGDAQLGAIRELVRRRGGGEPVAHITGEREFHGRGFAVTPDVLIPRPETETLVDLALARARQLGGDVLRIADLGTGSGCIAVTLAAELPGAVVIGTDLSDSALEVATSNARRHGVGDRIDLRQGSWAAPIDDGAVDLLVANPPYIPSAEIAGLPRDVGEHEPRLALDGGPDGLDRFRDLLPGAARVLAAGGWAAFEVDSRKADATASLVARALGPGTVAVHADLSGRPRVVSFARSQL